MRCDLETSRGECSRKCEYYGYCQECETYFIPEVYGTAMDLPFNSDFEKSLGKGV